MSLRTNVLFTKIAKCCGQGYILLYPANSANRLVIPPLDKKYASYTAVKFFDVRCQSDIFIIYSAVMIHVQYYSFKQKHTSNKPGL